MLRFVRVWLPGIVTLAGLVVMVARGFDDVGLEGGAGIIGAGLSIWLMNVLFRVGLHDDEDRDREDEARDFYGRHGHWPDEPGPGHAPPPAPAPPGEPASARRLPRDRPQRPPRRPG